MSLSGQNVVPLFLSEEVLVANSFHRSVLQRGLKGFHKPSQGWGHKIQV